MRSSRLARSPLGLGSVFLVLVGATAGCGDDTESGTSSGGGSSSDASTATGSVASTGTTSSSSVGGASGTGGDAAGGEGGAGTGGSGGDGGGGGAPLEVIEGPGFRSGSRLRPVYLDGGDGARKLLHWYDTELGSYCGLGVDGPGSDSAACVPHSFGARIAFTDEACTEAVFIAPDGDCDARFASSFDEHQLVGANAELASIVGVRTLHERGAPIATPAALYGRGSSCYPIELDEGETVHEALVSTVALAKGALEIEPIGAGLARGVVRTDDGAMQLVGEYDQETGSRCQYLGVNADGDWGCLPAVIAETVTPTRLQPPGQRHHHVDDACSVIGGTVFTAGFDVPPMPYVVGLGDEQGEVAAFAIGAEVDTPYTTRTGQCAEETTASYRVFEVGEPLDVTFPSVFFSAVIPAGRLAGVATGSAEGELLDTLDGFLDTERGEAECELVVFPEENDGGMAPLRCVTGTADSTLAADDYFADAACTEPLVVTDSLVHYVIDHIAPATCTAEPRRDEVERIARYEPHDGEVYEMVDTCVQIERGDRAWARAVPTTPEDFPAVTLVDPAAEAP